jgi:hypothetical protein
VDGARIKGARIKGKVGTSAMISITLQHYLERMACNTVGKTKSSGNDLGSICMVIFAHH